MRKAFGQFLVGAGLRLAPPSRAVSEVDGLDAFATMAALMGLPSLVDLGGHVDAIVCPPGLGERWREEEALRLFEAGQADHLIITGVYRQEKTWRDIEGALGLKGRANAHVIPEARHTLDQVDQFLKLVKQLGITSAAVAVSNYHGPRWYSCCVKGFERHGMAPILLVPAFVATPPDTVIPESAHYPTGKMTVADAVAGELKRIHTYRPKGDVATLEDLQSAIAAMWHHPLMVAHAKRLGLSVE